MDLGVNIFPFRFDFEKDVESTIEKISKTGAKFVEIWVNIGKEFDNPVHRKNQTWKAHRMDSYMSLIKKYGMVVHTAFLFFCEYDADVLAKDIQMLHDKYGIEAFVFMDTHIVEKQRADLTIDVINGISKRISKDITLLYHNHDNEYFNKINGQPIMEYMLERCPDLYFEADLGWLKFVGLEPNKYLEKYKDRVKMLHFKDINANYSIETKDTMYCVLGEGVVDLKTTLNELDKYPLLEDSKIIIDQDDSPNDIYEDIKKGIEFINNNY